MNKATSSVSRMQAIGSLVVVGTAVSLIALLVVHYKRHTIRQANANYPATFSPLWIVARSNRLTHQHTLQDLRGELKCIERGLAHVKEDLLASNHQEKLQDLSCAADDVSSRAASFLQSLVVDGDELHGPMQGVMAKSRELKTQINLLMVMRKKEMDE